MNHRKIIRQYLILTGMFNFGVSMSMATYVTFLMHRGLNLFQINLINMIFFTTMFFTEIPTGAFADRFGRKRSYVISCLLFSLGEIVYSQSFTIFGFVSAELIAGIGRTFANGAFHAWYVDTLKYHGFTGSTKPLFKAEQWARQLVSIPGAIIGAYIGLLDLSYPWLVGGIIGLISAAITGLVMKEDYFVARKTPVLQVLKEMLAISRTSLGQIHSRPQMRFIVIMGALLGFAVQAPNMQWQPFFGQSLGNRAWFGYIWMGIAIAILTGIEASSWILKKTKSEQAALIVSHVAAGMGLVAAIMSKNCVLLSIMYFLLHEIPRAAFGPIKDAYLNDITASAERATVISCQATYSHLGCLFGLFISGVIANAYSIDAAWLMSGSLLVSIPLLLVRRNARSPALA